MSDDDLDWDEDDDPEPGPWWGVWGLGLPEYDDPEETGAPPIPEPQYVYRFVPLDGPAEGQHVRLEVHQPGWRPGLMDWHLWAKDEHGLLALCIYRWRGDGYRLAMKHAPVGVMLTASGFPAITGPAIDIIDASPASTRLPVPTRTR